MVVPFRSRPAHTSSKRFSKRSLSVSPPPSSASLMLVQKVNAITEKSPLVGSALSDLVNRLYREVS